jgi:hypothetical protein
LAELIRLDRIVLGERASDRDSSDETLRMSS